MVTATSHSNRSAQRALTPIGDCLLNNTPETAFTFGLAFIKHNPDINATVINLKDMDIKQCTQILQWRIARGIAQKESHLTCQVPNNVLKIQIERFCRDSGLEYTYNIPKSCLKITLPTELDYWVYFKDNFEIFYKQSQLLSNELDSQE